MVELKNIHKSFGSNHVLRGIDLSAGTGEVVVIIGPSGSGKSTLLRCINFLARAGDGEITVDGMTIQCRHPAKKDVLALRRKTAMVFQRYNLFHNMTILENVTAGLVVRRVPKEAAWKRGLELL